MTRLWLVRHAPTHAKAAIGWTDIPADTSDCAAFHRLGAALPQDAVKVSSDLSRTMATAALLPGNETLPPRPGLREMHFGTWENRGFDDISAEDPALAREFWSNPGDAAPPGGESWNRFQARIATEISDLCREYTGRDLIVVAHFGVILAAIAHSAKMDPKAALSFKIDNLSLSRIDHLPGPDAFVIRGVNHTF